MKELIEEWKPINGYEGIYEISNYGIIRSFDRNILCKNGTIMPKKGKIKKFSNNGGGYPTVTLSKNCAGISKLVHLLVYDHFGDIKRTKGVFVDHIVEGDKSNNRIDNLQLVTPRINYFKYANTQNYSSEYVGVSYIPKKGKWSANITINNKSNWLGYFLTEEEAKTQYGKALIQIREDGSLTIKTPFRENKSSQYTGVYFEKRSGKWVSRVGFNKKTYWAGKFINEIDAHHAYVNKKKELENGFTKN